MIKTLFRRGAALLLTLAAVLSLSMPALAFTNASDWALSDLNEAQMLDLLPDALANSDMSIDINRMEMCYIATLAYEKAHR